MNVDSDGRCTTTLQKKIECCKSYSLPFLPEKNFCMVLGLCFDGRQYSLINSTGVLCFQPQTLFFVFMQLLPPFFSLNSSHEKELGPLL